MISMHSWVFKLLLFAIYFSVPIGVVSGLGLTPVFMLMALPVFPVCVIQKNHSPFALMFTVITGLLLFWMFISIFWAPEFESALGVWVRVTLVLVLGFTLIKGVSKMNEEQKRAIQRTLCMSMLIGCLIVVFELVTKGLGVTLLRNLIGGKEDAYDPNFMNRGLTFIVLLYWPFALSFYRFLHLNYHFKRSKIFWISVLAWVGIGSLLVQLESLSATLAFLASTAVFVVCWVTRGKLMPVVALLILLATASAPFSFRYLAPERVMEITKSIPPSAEHRLYIWEFVIERAAEHSVIGWGFNSSPDIPGGDVLIAFNETSEDDDRKLLPSHPHSLPLQIWLELGLIGFGIFIWLLGYTMYVLFRTPIPENEKSIALATVASYLCIGALSYGVWQYWWLCAGLVCWTILRAIISLDPHAHSRAMATN